MHKVVFLLVVAYLMIPLPLPLTVLIIKTSSVRTVCTTDIAGGIQYKCGAIIEIYKIPSNTLSLWPSLMPSLWKDQQLHYMLR